MSNSWRPSASVEALQQRSEFLYRIRHFFYERNAIEVQTPVLSQHTVTDVALDSIKVPGYGFLQTSPEFYLKRLLAAGLPSCFQLAPAYRDDEMGRWHNPEFTMLEWYRLGLGLESLQSEVAELVDLILGKGEYSSVTVSCLLRDRFGIDPHQPDQNAIMKCATQIGLDGVKNWRDALDFLISTAISEQDSSRLFITEYPHYMSALARTESRGENIIARRFELVVDGIELANAYDELADPEELLRRAEADNRERIKEGKEKIELDPAFYAAMVAGLPQCCGVAMGLDRLFALAMGASSIDEVLAFPWSQNQT